MHFSWEKKGGAVLAMCLLGVDTRGGAKVTQGVRETGPGRASSKSSSTSVSDRMMDQAAMARLVLGRLIYADTDRKGSRTAKRIANPATTNRLRRYSPETRTLDPRP